jgi:hypothetical protein
MIEIERGWNYINNCLSEWVIDCDILEEKKIKLMSKLDGRLKHFEGPTMKC